MESKPLEKVANEYFASLQGLMPKIDLAALGRIVEQLRLARERGSTIFVMGNGGSAATAAHFANDLGKATKQTGACFRIISLADNVAWLTALGNDEGYERIFEGQLENFVQPGDVVIGLSASGNSKNVLRAVGLARSRGALTIGLTGFDGGKLKNEVDQSLHIPTEQGRYMLVEDLHMIVLNIITSCFL